MAILVGHLYIFTVSEIICWLKKSKRDQIVEEHDKVDGNEGSNYSLILRGAQVFSAHFIANQNEGNYGSESKEK